MSLSEPHPAFESIRYRGMRPREAEVFRLWLQDKWASYDRFEFNVRVGAGADPGAQYPENIRRMAVANTQKRIDAVAWVGVQPTIIEVKDYAIQLAIGQVLEYGAVWQSQHAASPKPLLLIVCSNHEAGLLQRATDAGVHVNVLPAH